MPLKPVMARVWKAAPWLLAALVLGLVARQASTLDWAAVGEALTRLPLSVVGVAALIAVAGHLAVAGFDVVARSAVRHAASARRSALIGATGYAMNLNLGALIGGVAIRLDLYRRAGVPPRRAGRVVAGVMVANWCGWALLAAGLLVWAQPLPWPRAWPSIDSGLRAALALLLGFVPISLLALAALRHRLPTRWAVLRRELPDWPLVVAAIALAVASWSLAATTLWWLLQDALPWRAVAAALLLAAMAGVVTHVPGGLGVLEAVMLATPAGRIDAASLLAALLAYRAVYYGLPLLLALFSYAVLVGTSARSAAAPGGPGKAHAATTAQGVFRQRRSAEGAA